MWGSSSSRSKGGMEPITDRAGPLNLTIADRLEIALVLANEFDKPLGIVHSASTVASRLKGASHLNPEGRRKLSEARYPLAWGDEQVSPDAFLTGVVTVSSDLRKLTVDVLAFDNTGSNLQKVAQFTATNGPTALVEMRESFLLRGISNGR